MRSTLSPVAVVIVLLWAPAVASAASPCPPEVGQARTLLTTKTASAPKATRPSRSQASARAQDVQAPRSQDVQAPRSQDVQAPRKDYPPEPPEGPAPRGQDVQAPRNAAKGHATALANARRLVNEAEAACKDADGQRALANARAAMELLKYVP